MGLACSALLPGALLYLIGALVPCTDYRALRKGPLQVCACAGAAHACRVGGHGEMWPGSASRRQSVLLVGAACSQGLLHDA